MTNKKKIYLFIFVFVLFTIDRISKILVLNEASFAFKPEKLEDDLPVEKVLKSKNRFASSKLKLEYFKNLINRSKELNEEI